MYPHCKGPPGTKRDVSDSLQMPTTLNPNLSADAYNPEASTTLKSSTTAPPTPTHLVEKRCVECCDEEEGDAAHNQQNPIATDAVHRAGVVLAAAAQPADPQDEGELQNWWQTVEAVSRGQEIKSTVWA